MNSYSNAIENSSILASEAASLGQWLTTYRRHVSLRLQRLTAHEEWLYTLLRCKRHISSKREALTKRGSFATHKNGTLNHY